MSKTIPLDELARKGRLNTMSRQVTLELPDEILNRAERLATLARRDAREVLAEAVAVVVKD
jgi:predicted transcriptional regulator